jgi:hypothetical protein
MVLVHNYTTRWVCMCNCIGLYQEVNLPLSAEFCFKVNAVMLSFFLLVAPESTEWFTEDHADNSAPRPPTSPFSRQQVVSHYQSSFVSPVAFTDERRGEG